MLLNITGWDSRYCSSVNDLCRYKLHGGTCGQDSVYAMCNHELQIVFAAEDLDGKQSINHQLILKHSKNTLHECNYVCIHTTTQQHCHV